MFHYWHDLAETALNLSLPRSAVPRVYGTKVKLSGSAVKRSTVWPHRVNQKDRGRWCLLDQPSVPGLTFSVCMLDTQPWPFPAKGSELSAMTWMNLGDIALSGRSQSQRATQCVIPFIEMSRIGTSKDGREWWLPKAGGVGEMGVLV